MASKPAKPPPETPDDLLPDTAEHFDEMLNAIAREGGDPILDDAGQPVLDPKTKAVLRRRPSAAILQVIRGRLRDCGISGSKPKSKTQGIGGLAERMRRDGTLKFPAGGQLPPVSQDDDAATEEAV